MLTSLMLLIQRETHACVFDNNITHCDTGRARLADYLQGLQLAANALHALWPSALALPTIPHALMKKVEYHNIGRSYKWGAH